MGIAAAASPFALAEDGVPDTAIPSVADLETAATAILGEEGLTEIDPRAAVDAPLALPAVPAQTTAAEPVTEGAGAAAPPPEPAPETPPAPDPPEVEAAGATPAPVVAQTASANVNVTVRVDSPGDNGAVTQVNVATATGTLPAVPQYQPDRAQYQPATTASGTPAADPAPPSLAEPSAAEAPDGTWTWTWDCGDATPEISMLSDVGLGNWVWNWNGNCDRAQPRSENSDGELIPQYQPVVVQYRPININVSIRINSPGNDGPVLQANVAVAAPVLVPAPVVRPLPVDGAPQAEPTAAETPAQALAPSLLWFDGGEPTPIQDDLVACCLAAAPGDASDVTASSRNVLEAPHSPAVAGDITAPARFRAAVTVTLRLARAAERAATAERASRTPVRTVRPASPRRRNGPAREPAVVLNAAGMAPLNANDGRPGSLLLLVAGLAFAVAFAVASRSVAAEVRAAGEDPDPPPDHPG